MARADLTAARLRELLRYDPDTGHFVWLQARGKRRTDRPAGYRTWEGYWHICIDEQGHPAHRLVWLYVHGRWPKQVDHINGDRSDNRLCNLREADTLVNSQNQRRAHRDSKTGLIGAHLALDGRYRSSIRVGGKTYRLGSFRTAEEAHQAYVKAKRELHASCSI